MRTQFLAPRWMSSCPPLPLPLCPLDPCPSGLPPPPRRASPPRFVTQSCLTLCDPMGCIPPGSPVRGILQAGVLQWVAVSSSRESSRPRDGAQVSCMARGLFIVWSTGEAHQAPCPQRGHVERHRGCRTAWAPSGSLLRSCSVSGPPQAEHGGDPAVHEGLARPQQADRPPCGHGL